MWRLFTINSPYKQKARWAAVLWTLLIFFLCFLPGRDIPNVSIPLADKWAHMVLFGVFSFLWLCATPTRSGTYAFILLVISIFLGWLVEYIQGHYIEGRFQDQMDTLADSVGALLGILLFHIGASIAAKK